MAYEEYDYYNEPAKDEKSLKESLREILNGFKSEKSWRETGEAISRVRDVVPNVTESLARGGIGQAIGTSGDLREMRNTIQSYLPKSVQNWTQAAEFLANPYQKAIIETAPTTEQTLEAIPRATAPYKGYKQHETLGEYIAPSLGYFGAKALKASKDLPIGLTIQDVNKAPLAPKETEILASQADELGFHSPLENAILKIQQPKGTGDQFLKQLEKTPGVKTEELDVTGVKQYLLDHPNVTKQELLDYMGTNRLKLENKVLGEATGEGNTYEDYQLQGGDVYHDQDYIDSMADDLHYDMKNDDVIRSQEREALLEADPERYADYDTNSYAQARLEEDIDGVLWENAKQQAHDMYYENPIHHYYDEHGYDIYGNSDNGYTIRDNRNNIVNIGDHYDISDAEAALRSHLLDEGILGLDDAGGAKYEDYTLPGKYTNYREMLTTLPSQSAYDKASMDMFEFRKAVNKRLDKPTGGWDYEELTPQEQMKYDILNERMLRADKNKNEYQSSHFDEPNILAHTRLNDRIINGKKTLMVEEIQSDWHQAGRKKGYNEPKALEEIQKQRQILLDKKDYYAKLAEPYAAQGKDSPPDVIEGWTMAANGLQELDKKQSALGRAVPDAPFKKNWHELMMKQILNEAVKGDYDAVAFTTGKQQAERYSLSKQISELRAEKLLSGSKEGQYEITAINKNGNPSVYKTVTEDELENLIGKDLAKKIVEESPNNPDGKSYSGLDLDVGGEGMKGFYDKILPDFVNKYGKKYGMGMKKANIQPIENQFTDFQHWAINKDPSLHTSFIKDSWLKKDDLFKEWANMDKKSGEEVHMVDLTDAAKKDIKEKGQPLFSGIGLAAPALMPEDQDKTKK